MLTDKVLLRAAILYHKQLKKFWELKSRSDISAAYDYYYALQSSVCSSLQRHFDKISKYRDKRHAIELYKKRIIKNLSEISTYIKQIPLNLEIKEYQTPTLKEIIQEMKCLQKLFDTLEYRGKFLSIVTDGIILEDIDLGRFRITIDLEKIENHPLKSIIIEALDPNPARSNGDVIHPHVKVDDICFDEAGTLISLALTSGRLEDTFELLNTFLHTYNSSSPYVSLDSWEGQVCSICEEFADVDDSYSCEACAWTICYRCLIYCEFCEINRCTECSTTYECYSCGTEMCEECRHQCDECSKNICPSCHEEYQCSKCGQSLCENCVKNCTECSNTGCDSCIPSCEECQEHVCDQCGIECKKCGQIICPCCAVICDQCGNNCCGGCNNECNECGIDLCSRCCFDCENCGENFCKNCYDEDECSLLKGQI